jgi:hypothetical protein
MPVRQGAAPCTRDRNSPVRPPDEAHPDDASGMVSSSRPAGSTAIPSTVSDGWLQGEQPQLHIPCGPVGGLPHVCCSFVDISYWCLQKSA